MKLDVKLGFFPFQHTAPTWLRYTSPQHIPRYAYALHMRRALKNCSSVCELINEYVKSFSRFSVSVKDHQL